MIPLLLNAPVIPALSDADADLMTEMVSRISKKRRRNSTRRTYYEFKQGLKDLGIAIPPHLTDVETVVGWPAKAVDSMARRTVLEGFTRADGGDTDDLGLGSVWDENHMDSVVPQTNTSALIHSCAFGFVTAGDVEAGEPEALITTRSAEWATGIWDSRLRRLRSALSILSTNQYGQIDHMVMYKPGLAIIMRRNGQLWDVRQVSHDMGVPVELFPYRPSLDRPFGASRISRPVMALTDSAVRTLLRTEVSAEFFNAPRAYALGADEDAFVDKDGNPMSGWQVMLGRLLALSRDENGDLPQVGQFTQQSMEPNMAQLRMLAQSFSAETSLPLRSLGVVGDNPESEGAILEANEELSLEIGHWENASLGPAWRRLATHALRVIDDSPAAREAYASLRPRWRNQESATRAAQADAFTKVAQAVPDLSATEVGLEMAGMSVNQIERFMSERRRISGQQTLAAIAAIGEGSAEAAALEES